MEKRLILQMMLLLVVHVGTAQVQQGYIRTINRPNRQPRPLAGVTVSIGGVTNSVITDTKGQFSFSYSGQSYRIMRVQKQGYQLIDKEVIGRSNPFSSSVRHEIVMVSLADLQADKRRIEDKAYKRAEADYQRQLAAIQQKLEAQQISQQEATQQEAILGDNFQKYIDLIGNMAERYATIDYDGISEINRQILQCIENAELERADSLINSKGNIEQRLEQVREKKQIVTDAETLAKKARQDYEFSVNDIAEDLYNKYTIFKSKYQNDSAAYYIELRASLDTTNVEWQNQAGEFMIKRKADYPLALNYFQRALRHAMSDVGELSEWLGTIYNNIGWTCFNQGKYDEAQQNYLTAQIWNVVLGEYHPKVADNHDYLGDVYLRQDKSEWALDEYQKAYNIRKTLYGDNSAETAVSYHSFGAVYSHQKSYQKALEFYQKALALIDSLGEMSTVISSYYNDIGVAYHHQENDEQALTFLFKALHIDSMMLGEHHPSTGRVFGNIGAVYNAQGKTELALHYYLRGVEIERAVLGEQHPSIATSYNNIGLFYYELGNNTTALEYLQKSLEIRKAILGEKHSDLINSNQSLGVVYNELGKYETALTYYQQALSLQKELLGEQHKDVAYTYSLIGEAHSGAGNYDKAILYYFAAKKIQESVIGKQSLEVAETLLNIGQTYDKKKDYIDAEIYFSDALEIQIAILGEQHLDVATTYDHIGNDLLECGHYLLARESYEKALNIRLALLGSQHHEVALSYYDIGLAYCGELEKGFPQALDYFQKALEILKQCLGENHQEVTDVQEGIDYIRARMAKK